MTPPKGVLLDLTNPRYWRQNAQAAVRDVYDGLVELITNADDSYVRLKAKKGCIEIEIERKRKGTPSMVRVRDFAEGMAADAMKKYLWHVGDRVSGMEVGKSVRGTNSRGAKDVAIFGGVIFESIADDGKYHKCEITSQGRFIGPETSGEDVELQRARLNLPKGTGTIVTISVDPEVYQIPLHDTLRQNLRSLVVLRDIIGSPDRKVVLCDMNQGRSDVIEPLLIEGKERVNERIQVPGYVGVEAKLVIKRAKERLEDRGPRFRPGGILVKSRHAIHEATLFASDLENDPNAKWFYGRLTCDYLDDLWNEYDDRFEKGLSPTPRNPRQILDPMRKEGLSREHPFVDALFKEALKRLRPLVEEERRQAESHQARIESDETRKRLRALEKAAAKFMSENRDEQESPRDPNDSVPGSAFEKNGFSLMPPFAQLVKGHSTRFWLNVKQSAFPELAVGDLVEVSCVTDEISVSQHFISLEAHPNRESVLRCLWTVKGEKVTKGTGVKARVGAIVAESPIEVIESERDRYIDYKEFCFGRKRYTVQIDSKKSVILYAPCPGIVSQATPVEVECSSPAFRVGGTRTMVPNPDLGIAICKLSLSASKSDMITKLTATIPGHTCEAEAISVEPIGATIKIELKDVDHKNQRYVWRANILEIAARHPSLRRYLGDAPKFPGQEANHYRVLLAEIVAEAVCSRLISRKETDSPEEYSDSDWDAYYAEYTAMLTKFLPIAHETQVKI
jgi:hypothetical protein